MNWEVIIEYLKTERIIEFLSKIDIGELLTNPFFIVPFIIFACYLIFTKRVKYLVGIIAIFVLLKFLPEFMPAKPTGIEEQPFSLTDLAKFITILFAVGIVVIYFFFVRKD